MEKNHSVTHSPTHPAYLMRRELKLSLRNTMMTAINIIIIISMNCELYEPIQTTNNNTAYNLLTIVSSMSSSDASSSSLQSLSAFCKHAFTCVHLITWSRLITGQKILLNPLQQSISRRITVRLSTVYGSHLLILLLCTVCQFMQLAKCAARFRNRARAVCKLPTQM